MRRLGVDDTWASETDTRPTMMALLGLTVNYQHQGRVLTEIIDPGQMPPSLSSADYADLASLYTQLESPVGPFGLDTLTTSTRGLGSTSPQDLQYTRTEDAITRLGSRRDRLGAQMITLLEGATFAGRPIPHGAAESLSAQGWPLLQQAQQLARGGGGQ